MGKFHIFSLKDGKFGLIIIAIIGEVYKLHHIGPRVDSIQSDNGHKIHNYIIVVKLTLGFSGVKINAIR